MTRNWEIGNHDCSITSFANWEVNWNVVKNDALDYVHPRPVDETHVFPIMYQHMARHSREIAFGVRRAGPGPRQQRRERANHNLEIQIHSRKKGHAIRNAVNRHISRTGPRFEFKYNVNRISSSEIRTQGIIFWN